MDFKNLRLNESFFELWSDKIWGREYIPNFILNWEQITEQIPVISLIVNTSFFPSFLFSSCSSLREDISSIRAAPVKFDVILSK